MITNQGVPQYRNGDRVVKYMTKNELKNKLDSIQGTIDLPTLLSIYEEDPEKNHLGMMSLWGDQAKRKSGLLPFLLEKKSILNVNGWRGKFSYDLPIRDFHEVVTTKDNNIGQPNAGIDGDTFKLVLNKAFTVGDVLAVDKYHGQQVMVVNEEPVTRVAEGWEHTVILVTNDKAESYSPEYLMKGRVYEKVGHGIGERTTEFSHVSLPEPVGYMTCEFQLGSALGVEGYVTGMADSVKYANAAKSTSDYLEQVHNQYGGKDLALISEVYTNSQTGKQVARPKSVATTMELLVFKELDRLVSSRLMFQKAARVNSGGNNGVINFTEGLYHQLRRGKLIQYGRPGGITRQHIKQLVDYLFLPNPDIEDINRRIKLDCGKFAFENVLEIFKEEVQYQMGNIAPFLGSDALVKGIVTGKDLNNLELNTIRFTKVYVAGIGTLELNHEPSMDYADTANDRFAAGMNPGAYAPTAYAILVTDTNSQYYSNNKDLPRGAKLIENGDANANIFLVKPEGEMYYWGKSQGRYSSVTNKNIQSAYKQMGEETWAYAINAIWVKDLSRFAMIELDPAARKGFN